MLLPRRQRSKPNAGLLQSVRNCLTVGQRCGRAHALVWALCTDIGLRNKANRVSGLGEDFPHGAFEANVLGVVKPTPQRRLQSPILWRVWLVWRWRQGAEPWTSILWIGIAIPVSRGRRGQAHFTGGGHRTWVLCPRMQPAASFWPDARHMADLASPRFGAILCGVTLGFSRLLGPRPRHHWGRPGVCSMPRKDACHHNRACQHGCRRRASLRNLTPDSPRLRGEPLHKHGRCRAQRDRLGEQHHGKLQGK
mmetsp:Transcript_59382/g.139097  ORF Transcript_59382/g.139097 Transcript_59382/m.139097 type:complete len:251 (-) Transcript_59382:8-760(-)